MTHLTETKTQLTWRKIAPVAAVTVAAGVGIVWSIFAAGTPVAFEAESGALAAGATLTTVSGQSGSGAVKFAAAATPTPTPTASPSAKPDATNTGLPAGTALTVVNGDLNITTAGQVVEGKDVRGFVNISASNVTFRNSIVKGRTASNGFQGVINVNSGTGIKIENVTISPSTPSVYLDGVWGDNFTATALNIQGTVDGMKAGSNTVIERSFIHDLAFFSSDPSQGGGETHNDGIQILEGATITVRNNNINPGSGGNAAIQVTQDYGPVTNLLIDGNWMDGGGCTLNIAQKGGSSLTATANNNRFGHNSGFANCPILIGTKVTLNRSNNVWDVVPNAGQAVPIQQHD